MGKRHWYGLGGALGLVIILVLSPISASPVRPTEGKWASAFRPYGGYIDELLLKIYTNISQAMEALQRGEIDAYDERVLLKYLPALESDPDIHVSYTPSTSIRHLGMNCDRFPTNITGYRRAMAFGMDKYKATEEAVGGYGTVLDSFIPPVSPITEWAVEDQLPEHFYDVDFVSGNKSLEAVGFKDLDHDGWREYDKNGNGQWDVGIDLDDNDPRLAINLTATAGYSPAIIACTVAHEGLAKMGMRSTVEEKSWEDLQESFFEGDYWVACSCDIVGPYQKPPQFLFQNFRTGKDFNLYYFRFSNATIDAVLDQMYAATNTSDRQKYCCEAGILLAYELPGIVIYNEMVVNAYRTDNFEGYFGFKGYGPVWAGQPWDSYIPTKVRLKESERGPYGGTFKYSLSYPLLTKNVFNLTAMNSLNVFRYVFECLWLPDPNTWDPIPALAHDWDIEPTVTNPSTGIQDGQKFTFYLLENATFHDGQLVTSEDVYYSFELFKKNHLFSHILTSVYKFEMPDVHTFIMYVNRTDDYAFSDFTNAPGIVPWHVWKDVTNLTDFSLLPDFIATDAHMIGSGPFKWNERSPGKYISLLRHEDWHYAVPHEPEPATTSSPESSSKSSTPARGFEIVSVYAVILITIIRIKRRRK